MRRVDRNVEAAKHAALLWKPNEYERRVLRSGHFTIHRLSKGNVFVGRDTRNFTCQFCGGPMDGPHNMQYRVYREPGGVTRQGWYCQPTAITPPSVHEFQETKTARMEHRESLRRKARALFEETLTFVKKAMRRSGAHRPHQIVANHCDMRRRVMQEQEGEELSHEDIELVIEGVRYMVLEHLGYGIREDVE